MEKKTIWILLESAADTIMETLFMDAHSKTFDAELRKEISDAWDGLKIVEIEAIKMLIETLEGETVPMANHDDPGAIDDCWKILLEMFQ